MRNPNVGSNTGVSASVQDILFNFNHNLISDVILMYIPPKREYCVLLVVVSRDGK